MLVRRWFFKARCLRAYSYVVMSYLWKRKQQSNDSDDLVQVKSKFEAEFRRFSIPKPKIPNAAAKQGDENESEEPCWSLEAFRVLVQKLHGLPDSVPFNLHYTDPTDGDLLPINNNDNFRVSLFRSNPVLRLHVNIDGSCGEQSPWALVQVKNGSNSLSSRFLFFGADETSGSYNPASVKAISRPKNFRHISTLIDADQLPPSQRKVRLRKSKADGRPLGFCIRDGSNARQNAEGETIRIPGIFISRLIPGGLAESTGLLAVNDEILEVNGVFIGEGSKTLDQVTDMMVATATDLIITIKTPEVIDSNEQVKTMESNLQGSHRHRQTSVSLPSTPENTLRSKKVANLRAKRKEVASSVFYVGDSENDNEDTVISFINSN